jgi:glycosyltransferase involved in cell wall biosynthesis
VTTAAGTRVFFVNRYFHPDESATSQLLCDLAFALVQRGYRIHVVCARQLYGAAGANLPPLETVHGVVVHRVWTTRFGRRRLFGRALDYLSFYLWCGAALLRQLRPFDIVVAETDPPLISIVAAMAAKSRRAILINWLQDVFPEVATQLGASPLPPIFDALLRYLRDVSLRSAFVNVVLGSRMAEYLQTRGIEARKIRIIENWADAASVRPKPSAQSALRRRLGLDGQFVVGYSGNLGRAHEYESILGAAEILRDDASVSFLLIGGGVNMEALQARVAERNLAHVHFLPYQPRDTLEDSLAAADVHLASLLPALEGLIVPSKFYGILAAGRPVLFIGDPDGELARVIREAQCGMALSVGEPAPLAEAVRRLQRDGELRSRMGAAARQLSERYTAARALSSWTQLLASIPGTRRH